MAGGGVTFFQDPSRIAWRPIGAVAIIDLLGDVTHVTEPPMLELLQQVTSGGFGLLVLHFHESGYITSAGITLVLRAAAAAQRAGQQIAITGLTEHYGRMFRMAGIEAYAPIYGTEAEAVAALQQDRDDAAVA
jgi:anti-anti-sigma factor